MGSEIIAAIVGAVIGALLAVGGGFLQHKWTEADRKKQREAEDRLQFVREVMRHRLNYGELVLILNEVPLMFGDDAEAMDHYRKLVAPENEQEHNQALVDLITHLANCAGMPAKVRVEDVSKGLSTEKQIDLGEALSMLMNMQKMPPS